jgi:hypothetical protein
MTTIAPARAGLTADRPVSRRLVHKLAVEEVFVTGAVADGDLYVALAQLPRAHRLYGDSPLPYHDIGLIGEASRQAVMTVLHEFLEVPFDARFVIRSVRVALEDLAANRRASTPTEMEVEVRFDRIRERRGSIRSVTGVATCRIGGAPSATFEGTLAFLPAELYASMRDHTAEVGPASEAAAAPAVLSERSAAASVGRSDPRNVVLSPLEEAGGTSRRATVVVDPADPVFFDHPQDHYPGTVLLEAARQMATATAMPALGVAGQDLVVRELDAEFARFAELGAALECEATLEDGATVGAVPIEVVMHQGGEQVARIGARVVHA